MKYLKGGVNYIRLYAAEILIIILILLNIFDFLELLPAEVSYIKKIISYTALFYLLYKISITKIFFNNENKNLDFLMIFTYFLFAFYKFIGSIGKLTLKITPYIVEQVPLGVKAAVQYIPSTVSPTNLSYVISTNVTNLISITNPSIFIKVTNGIESAVLLLKARTATLNYFFFLILKYAQVYEKVLFIIAGISMIALAFYIVKHLPAKKPSLVYSITKNMKSFPKFCVVYAILVGFYIIIANQALEWLTIGIDAPLLMTGIFFFAYLIWKHKERFRAKNILFKLGSWGDAFYEKFLELFKDKKTLPLAFSGILILFMIVDVGLFVLPYTIGYDRGPDKAPILIDTLYYEKLNPEQHQPISNLIINDAKSAEPLYKKILSPILYILNITGLFFLMVIPAVIWGVIYKRKHFIVPRKLVILFFVSVTTFFTIPAFAIRQILAKNLVGVDIISHTIINQNLLLPLLYIVIAIVVGYYLTKHFYNAAIVIMTALSTLFFTYYVFIYFMSILDYNLSAITATLLTNPFITFYFILFFLIYAVFYVTGYLSFIYEAFIKR
ncbi:hypothetical protein DRJ17_03000 [Candidatus Woesearchaeota archaeon]|nr:MAG: hypothetical protein DRJ17_03000 [Candidatus Woesearchaeota archaeon]